MLKRCLAASPLALWMLCLLPACSSYRIERPLTESGRLCAAQCDRQQSSCDSVAEAQAAANTCDSANRRANDFCSGYTQEKDRNHCMAENSAPVCFTPAPDYSACRAGWEQCVLSCGGRMVEK